MDGDETNGPHKKPQGDAYVLLVFHKDKFTCEVTGQCENLDQALAMCEMAKRYFERQLNTAEASKIFGPLPAIAMPFPRGGRG